MNLTIDLSKVIYCRLLYSNQCGLTRLSKPTFTINGVSYEENELASYIEGYEQETCIERARRLGLLDVWTPLVIVKMQSRYTLTFSGTMALRIWRAWQSKIFNKKKR